MRFLFARCLIVLHLLPAGLRAGSESEEGPRPSSGNWMESLPMVYLGQPGEALQSVKLRGIIHAQLAGVNASQGSQEDFEFRRFRLGFDARFLNHFMLRGTIDLDPERGRLYRRLAQTYLTYSPFGNEGANERRLRLVAGKMRSRFSGEWGISARRLKTFERSLLPNQLAPRVGTGLRLEIRERDYDFAFSALAGERAREFGWYNDGALFLFEVGYSPAPAFRVGFDYLGISGDQNLTATRISHAFSLSAEYNPRYTEGDFAFLFDFLLGLGDQETPDVGGIVFLTSYQLDDRWEMVARYQYAHSDGPDGIRLQRRYERLVVPETEDQRGESYHAFYFGVNYRLYDGKLKGMLGGEYAKLDGNPEGSGFDGWTWFAGLRMWF